MRRVMVTHTDSPVGRRLVKALYHDPDITLVFGTGTGPRPSFLDAYRTKCVYQRLDLAKARHLSNFFRSERFARAHVDSVVHLPFVTEQTGERIPGNVSSLVSETRRLTEECKNQRSIQRFVYLSSAFVYQPEPGNVNVFSEDQLLGFDMQDDPQVRAWVDADLVCQGELNDPRLMMTILRPCAIVTESGDLLQCPPLAGAGPPIGFDPMLSLVSDRDVARALVLALYADRPGVYNIAGQEVFPCSELMAREVRFGPFTVPAVVSSVVSLLGQTVGLRRRPQTAFARYGIVLDTRLAEDVLGFQPQYRLEVRRQGGTVRVETVRAR